MNQFNQMKVPKMPRCVLLPLLPAPSACAPGGAMCRGVCARSHGARLRRGTIFTTAGGLALTVGGYVLVNHCMYNVEGGHRAVVYSRLSGMSQVVKGEGTHFKLPWLQRPYIYNVRSTPRNIKSKSGSQDLQMVDINVRIIYRPNIEKLPEMYRSLGLDYDERVLPSIANEVPIMKDVACPALMHALQL